MTEPAPPRDTTADTRRMRAVLVAACALAFAVAPAAFPFAGFEPDLFPVPQVDPPVQPAGWAFAIWGPIYLWLLASAAFGLVRRGEAADWDRGRWPLAGSLAVGAAWLAVAQASALWATLLIVAMLALALVALARAPMRDRWLLRAPLALYAGWLTAASWVALGLVGAGFDLWFGAYGWAIVGLGGALSTAATVLLRLRAVPFYALAVIWALAGIAAGNLGEAPGLVVIALAGAAAIAFLAFRDRRSAEAPRA